MNRCDSLYGRQWRVKLEESAVSHLVRVSVNLIKREGAVSSPSSGASFSTFYASEDLNVYGTKTGYAGIMWETTWFWNWVCTPISWLTLTAPGTRRPHAAVQTASVVKVEPEAE
jgi:hypothetical protein